MPSYDFKCKDCDHQFSVTMSVAEYGEGKTVCPKCNSKNLKRLISLVSVITSKKS